MNDSASSSPPEREIQFLDIDVAQVTLAFFDEPDKRLAGVHGIFFSGRR
jgi:hypothetical protein